GSDRIRVKRPGIGEDEVEAVTAVLRSGWLTTGNECRQFEAEFARFIGARHAVAVSSCAAALHLALEASGCQRGDCVLVPTLTFAATAEVVAYFGAIPILIDCERDTLNVDVAAAARAVADLEAGRPVGGVVATSRVHAIMPVHYGGQMADVDGIFALTQRHNLRVVEDAPPAPPAAARRASGQGGAGRASAAR